MPSDRDDHASKPETKPETRPANIAPDAVMDPNEKTDGKPGEGGGGGKPVDGETDPGGS